MPHGDKNTTQFNYMFIRKFPLQLSLYAWLIHKVIVQIKNVGTVVMADKVVSFITKIPIMMKNICPPTMSSIVYFVQLQCMKVAKLVAR